jgi:hypothetical protein
MIKLLATVTTLENGTVVHDTTWFNDPDDAEMYAQKIVEELKLLPGVVDWHVTLADVSQRDSAGAEIFHACLDDVQPYYEHRMAWRDNYDVARYVAAKRRRLSAS